MVVRRSTDHTSFGGHPDCHTQDPEFWSACLSRAARCILLLLLLLWLLLWLLLLLLLLLLWRLLLWLKIKARPRTLCR